MKNVSWDAFQLFLAVADHGGLTGAADSTGLSPATLGRRMLDLEQRLATTLFERSQTGYRLTGAGERLRTTLADMEAAARQVEAWRGAVAAGPVVRIACGTWNAQVIATNILHLCGPRDRFRLELTSAEQRAQLAHRENDIGIRAFEPEERNLASVPAGEVAYAPYRARNAAQATAGRWIAVNAEDAVSGYLRWPHQHRAADIVLTVNRARNLCDLALSGAGIAVLPTFVGDAEQGLERAGDEIADLRHRQWIVMNNDDRHRPEVRAVVERLRSLLMSVTRRA